MGKVRYTAVAPTVATVGRLTAQFIELRDPASFEELVRRYSAFIYSVAYQITTDRHDAEDAAQIAFLQLAIALKSGKKIDKPVGWLESVARKQALRMIRSKSRLRRREQKVSKSEMHEEDHVNSADDVALAGVVRDALDQLPEHYRLPLVLHYFGGMSLETIAAELKTNPNTVGTRLHRGRKMLGHRLEKLGLRFDVEALSLLLASLIPAAIAKAVLQRVRVPSNAPSGLATSILQTLHLSLGMAMQRKLRIATLILAAAAMSAAMAKTFKMFSFPHINLRGMIQRVENLFSPRVELIAANDAPVPAPNDPSPLEVKSFAPNESPPLEISSADSPSISRVENHSTNSPASVAPVAAASNSESIQPIIPAEIQNMPETFAEDATARREMTFIAPTEPASSDLKKPHPSAKASKLGEPSLPEPELLSTGSGGVDFSGARASVVVPPFQDGGQKLRGFGDLDITGSFVQNGRVVADGGGSHRELNLSDSPSVQNTIDNPPNGSNGWYAVNGGKLTLPPLHVTSADRSYTWGESASDPQLDLINSVRLTPIGLKRGGDVSISLMTLADNEQQFDSLPSGWGVVGLWQIDRGGMEAQAIELAIRYNQIAAAYLPMTDQLLTFLTYDGQWEALPFDAVELDRADHLIDGALGGSFDYFAVAGPLDPVVDPSSAPIYSSLAPEPVMGILPVVLILLHRRRRRG